MNPEPEVVLSGTALADLLEAVVERGVPFRFTATGASMNPSIRHNDIVTISPVGVREPRVGQVAAIRQPTGHRLLVHRIVQKRGKRALIRGDRCRDADGWIPVDKIMGVVTAVERKGRRCFWPWSGSWAFTAPLRRKLLPLRHLGYRALRRAYRTFR